MCTIDVVIIDPHLSKNRYSQGLPCRWDFKRYSQGDIVGMTASIEVIDAVQQLLESEGVLQSIRAQLRASVINALFVGSADSGPR